MKLQSPTSIKNLFFRGLYLEILSETVSPADKTLKAADLSSEAFTVGALAFTGNIEEAQSRFATLQSQFNIEDLAACRFYLGVALCRHSMYSQARVMLGQNLRSLRTHKKSKSLVNFYAFQGLGFYRYFCGRFKGSLKATRQAQQAALNSENPWAQLLTTDLIGHSLVQTGEVSLGLKNLERASKMASSLGNGGTVEALRVAIACYRAQFGIEHSKALRDLKKLSQTLSAQDTYSQAAVLLELGRQYLLCGRADDAKTALNQSCRFIFGSRNRRQGVLINLRFAMYHALRGEYELGLNLLMSASRDLVPGIDLALEVEVLGLQEKLYLRLGIVDTLSEIRQKIKYLTRVTQRGISLRILKRKTQPSSVLRAPGEDPQGDVLDVAQSNPAEFIRAGYFGLLSDRLVQAPGGVKLIFCDLLPGSLCVFNQGNVSWTPNGVTPTIRKLLEALGRSATQEISKEQLLEEVWGYRFRSLSRDQLVYSTVSRLRQMLGPQSSWLEVRENGYALASSILVTSVRKEVAAQAPFKTDAFPDIPPAVRAPANNINNLDLSVPFNQRQIKILRSLENGSTITTRSCLKRFRVSEITASRDLAALHKQGLIRKIGRGRAVCYQGTTSSLPAALKARATESK